MDNPFKPLPKLEGTYPLTRQGTIRNTNPFGMQHRREQRQTDEYSAWLKSIDPNLRQELKGFGDYYTRRYMNLAQAGGQANEQGKTPAEQFLEQIRKQKFDRDTEWNNVYGKLDANTRNAFARFAPAFQNAYVDALLAGNDTVVMNINGRDVQMTGIAAAREIYRQAETYRAQMPMQAQKKAQQHLQNTNYRVVVGGF